MGTCGVMAELEHNQGAPTPQSNTQQNRETPLNAERVVMAESITTPLNADEL